MQNPLLGQECGFALQVLEYFFERQGPHGNYERFVGSASFMRRQL